MNQCKTSWKWSSLTIIGTFWFWNIFTFFSVYFFPLLTSGKDLEDYKHHHILAVEQRFSEDSCLSIRFRGFILIWKTSDPQKGHMHWLDLRCLWDFLSLLTVQDHILGTGSPCPTLAVGCCLYLSIALSSMAIGSTKTCSPAEGYPSLASTCPPLL